MIRLAFGQELCIHQVEDAGDQPGLVGPVRRWGKRQAWIPGGRDVKMETTETQGGKSP